MEEDEQEQKREEAEAVATTAVEVHTVMYSRSSSLKEVAASTKGPPFRDVTNQRSSAPFISGRGRKIPGALGLKEWGVPGCHSSTSPAVSHSSSCSWNSSEQEVDEEQVGEAFI